MIVMWVCTRGESPCDNWKAFQTNYTISASLLVLQGRKYVKRSELERVQVPPSGEDGQGGVVSEESGKQAASSSLLSPTSVTSPVEESPIFSIPKAEVCVYVGGGVLGRKRDWYNHVRRRRDDSYTLLY